MDKKKALNLSSVRNVFHSRNIRRKEDNELTLATKNHCAEFLLLVGIRVSLKPRYNGKVVKLGYFRIFGSSVQHHSERGKSKTVKEITENGAD